MYKTKSSIKPFDKKNHIAVVSISLLTILTVSSSQPTAWGRPDEADRDKIIRRIAQNWILVGTEQYRRAFFKNAEQSFYRAQEHLEYLTANEREKLNELLVKIDMAMLERKRILGHIEMANEFVEQDKLIRAKTHLERAKNSKFLTERERQLIAKGLRKLDNRLNERKKEPAWPYNSSNAKFYLDGQIGKDRQKFIEIVENGLSTTPQDSTTKDYFIKADNTLDRAVEPSPATKLNEPAILNAIANPTADKDRHIEVADRKRKILQSYAKAVVNDAVNKAQDCVRKGKFYKAKQAVQAAEQALKENQQHIENELLRQYHSELEQLSEQIAQGRSQWLGSREHETTRKK